MPGAQLKLYLQGAGFGGAFAGKLQQADDAEAVLWRDGERGGAEDGVADVGVEAAIVAAFGLHLARDERRGIVRIGSDGERAPGGFVLLQPDLLRALCGDPRAAD